MIVLVIAGGSGSRLWPLSTSDYPKHLLQINGKKSLLQNTFDRASKIGKKVYVVTDISHSHHVEEQLPTLPKNQIVIEPGRKGTANCIVMALQKIAENEDHDEPIAILSADHYIRDQRGLLKSFRIAEQATRQANKIVLVGASPDYPATGFGYIQQGEALDSKNKVYKVKSFKEKPNFETAKGYLKNGKYLWNCGYFVGSINTFIGNISQYSPGLLANYSALAKAKNESLYRKIYENFQSDTIDYALIEKVKELLVVQADFDWMDLGSYSDIHKAVLNDDFGNHVQGNKVVLDTVNDSFVRNLEDKPVVIIGVDDIVVVNTPSGVLVARKDMSQKIGEISKNLPK